MGKIIEINGGSLIFLILILFMIPKNADDIFVELTLLILLTF